MKQIKNTQWHTRELENVISLLTKQNLRKHIKKVEKQTKQNKPQWHTRKVKKLNKSP